MASANSSYDDVRSQIIELEGQKMLKTVPSVEDSSVPRQTTCNAISKPTLYHNSFFSSEAPMAAARKQYLKIMFGGVVVLTLVIFMIFSILWGAYFRTPSYNLTGWIIVCRQYCHQLLLLNRFKDFDGSTVGQAVVDGLTQPGIPSKIDWSVLQAEQFPDGIVGVSHAVAEHQTWVAVTGSSNLFKSFDVAFF